MMRQVSKCNFVTALNLVIPADASVVVIHSNVFSFGVMTNALEQIMEAIEDVIQPHQTILMPTFTFSFCKTGWYDAGESPSETGSLTEYFRCLPGVSRTRCPINSFAVRGPKRLEYFESDLSKTCWGEDSIYARFCRDNAVIVGLGEPLALKSSIFHHAEEKVGLPYRYFKTFSGTVNFGTGPQTYEKKMYVRRIDLPVQYDYSAAIEIIKKKGEFRREPLGASFVESIRARDAVDTLTHLLKQDPFAVLVTKEEYLLKERKRSLAFLASHNLDLFARRFADAYRETIGEDCRQVGVPFGQYRQHIVNPESDLRVIDPQYVIFAERFEDVFDDAPKDIFNEDGMRVYMARKVDDYVNTLMEARKVLNGRFFVLNFEAINPPVFCHAEINYEGGQTKQVEWANDCLRKAIERIPDIYLCDYRSVLKRCGIVRAFDPKYWYIGRIAFSADLSKDLSLALIGMMLAVEGKTARLLVLDLDNTLWGGVIGDDEMEGVALGGDYPGNAYVDFQIFLKDLTRRGIALAVSSKNTESVAMAMMINHPHMVLRPEDFAGVEISWENKAVGIRRLCERLSLGTYSVMFIDDNPVERQWIRKNIPDCIVPEMPESISQWIFFLSAQPYLQSVRVTDEDLRRAEHYTNKKKEEGLAHSFNNIEDFLRSLDMRVLFSPYQDENSQRVLQLISKTNQFNTTTRRYTQQDLNRIVKEERGEIFAVSFTDKIFQKEIIGVVILKFGPVDRDVLIIDSFIMSCRVLGRDIEKAVLGWILRYAKRLGLGGVIGEMIETPKNEPTRALYSKNGFAPLSDQNFFFDLRNRVIPDIPDYFILREDAFQP